MNGRRQSIFPCRSRDPLPRVTRGPIQVQLDDNASSIEPSTALREPERPGATGTEPPADKSIDRPGWDWRGAMFVRRISCFSIVTALCAASLMLIAQGTSALSNPSGSAAPASVAHVDRTAKSDRLMRPRVARSSANAVAIEFSGPSDVVIRDQRGNTVFRRPLVPHYDRGQTGWRTPDISAGAWRCDKPLPEGCGGSLSPYTDPSKAHILGRCLS